MLDALGKKDQATASEYLRAMMYAETRSACQNKRDKFVLRFKKTDPKACATLMRDWERLVSFFDYPQEHWTHLRTSNIVESPRPGAIANRCIAAFQEDRERRGNDLEAAVRC